jgi:hypothetical protein
MYGKIPVNNPTPTKKLYDPTKAVPQGTILCGQQDPIMYPTIGPTIAVVRLIHPGIRVKEFCSIVHSNRIAKVKKIVFPNKPPITFPDKQPKVKAEAIIITIRNTNQNAYDQDPCTYSLTPYTIKLLHNNPEIPPAIHL